MPHQNTGIALSTRQQAAVELPDVPSASEQGQARSAASATDPSLAPVTGEADALMVPIDITLRPAGFAMPMAGKTRPIEDKECIIVARLPDGSSFERRLRTDRFGKAVATVPRDGVGLGADGKSTEVEVRLVQQGYQERFELAQARMVDGDLRLSAELVLCKGTTARGLVIGHLSGARLPIESLEVIGQEGRRWGESLLRSEDRVQWTKDGRFAVHFTESCQLDFLARCLGHGSGSLSEVALDVTQPPQALVIEVAGPARITGLLVTSEGSPPLPVKLRAVSKQLQRNDWSLFGRRRSTAASREGAGLLEATALSATDGTFEIRGLRVGEYTVFASVPLTGDVGYLVIGETMASPTPGLMKATLDVSHLVVSLEDATGRPWEPKAEPRAQLQPQVGDKIAAWPKEPRIVVRDAGSIGGPLMLNSPVNRWDWKPDQTLSRPNRKVYRVAEGRQYQVSVVGGSFTGSIQTVAVPEGGGAVVAHCQAGQPLGLGMLELSVTGAEEGSLSWGYRAEVFEAQHPNGPILAHTLWGAPPYRFELPGGDYDVRLQGASVRTSHFTSPPPDVSRVTKRVRIVEGESTRETLPVRRGGSLEVSIECETPSTAAHRREGLRVDDSRPLLPAPREQSHAVEIPRGVARLALLHPSGDVEVVLRSAAATGPRKRSFLTDTFPSGEAWTSTSVSAGSFILYARLGDGRERRQPITVAEGAPTAVTVAFD